MRISQRLDYTLRMLVALARMREGTSVAAGDLAVRLGLPRRFGEQQMTALAKTSLVASRRGAGGGISLGRPASEISVLEIVRAVQGEALDIPLTAGSATAELWRRAAGALEEQLAATTLDELARRQAELDAESSPMYYI
jgi:Rrf2 family protein